MADIEKVKCAACNVPLQGRAVDVDSQIIFSCPSCGNGDTEENVMREIGEQARDKVADEIAASFERATRSSKTVTFKKGSRPKKVYRFRIDL